MRLLTTIKNEVFDGEYITYHHKYVNTTVGQEMIFDSTIESFESSLKNPILKRSRVPPSRDSKKAECIKIGSNTYTIKFHGADGSFPTSNNEFSADLNQLTTSWGIGDEASKILLTRTTPRKKSTKVNFLGRGEAKSCIEKEFINDGKFKLANKCNQSVNLKFTYSRSKPFAGVYSTIENNKSTFDEGYEDEDVAFYACFAPSAPQSLNGKCFK